MIPSSRPTFCGGLTKETRLREIFNVLSQISAPVLLLANDTPQGKAYEFIISSDEMEPLYCPDDDRLLQRYVLSLVYYSTTITPWITCGDDVITSVCPTNEERFLSPVPECDWFGVTCDARERIRVLRIDDNNLSGTLPDVELSSISSMVQLDLDGNKGIAGTLPDAFFSNNAGLQTLDLDENRLTGTIPDSLYSLPALMVCDLNDNALEGTISTLIGNMESLFLIQLDNNALSGTMPTEIGLLANNVDTVTVANNTLGGQIPAELGNLSLLRFLNVQGNELSGQIPPVFGALSNLERLLLDRNSLTGEIPADLGNLLNLEQLELHNNNLFGEMPASICALRTNGVLEILTADCDLVTCTCCTTCFR